MDKLSDQSYMRFERVELYNRYFFWFSIEPRNQYPMNCVQREQQGVLEQWVASIRMHDMHEDCQPSTNLKDSISERQQQRVERKLAQVRTFGCSNVA